MKPANSPVIRQELKLIGENISLYRRMQRLTSRQLADRAGVSRDTVSSIENGSPGVSFASVLSVCRVLGILEPVSAAFDPAGTERGRILLIQGVPERVR